MYLKQKSFKTRMSMLREKTIYFFRAKGIYVVLMGCVVLIGVAAALLFTLPPAKDSTPQPTPPIDQVSSSEDERLEAVRTPELTPSPTPIPDFTQAPPSNTPQTKPNKASPPVAGEIIWGFAVSELIYSRTLDQWMTHAGVDIASPKGSEVRAVYGGTVNRVYLDDALGVTIEITCANGILTVYANLKEAPPVKEGNRVSAGDVIGYVGTSALSECGDQSHLHFELYKDGKPVDPNGYVLFMK